MPPFQGGWNRGGSTIIERYLHFGIEESGGLRCSMIYRGVSISGGWNRGVPLYTEVSPFQGVGIEGFHCIQRCLHFRGLE